MNHQNIYNFTVKDIKGEALTLQKYAGQVLLIVNVASECGLTPQYEALEKIYEKYQKQGFVVLGFPANEFGAQEPGSNAQIEEFCTTRFGIRFPMFEKVVVKGEGLHPLFQYLTEVKKEAQLVNGTAFEDKLKTYGFTRENPKDILWNFEKFLISRDGNVIARFAPDMEPENSTIIKAIEMAI